MRYRKPIPALLEQSQAEKIAELQRQEIDFGWQITHPFERLLMDWRTRVEQFFLRAQVVSLRPDRQAVWDPSVATPAALEAELLRPLRTERATAEQGVIPPAQERQRAIFLLAALFARWQLSLGGIDTSEPLPSPARELGSIDGVGLRGRMSNWGQIFQAKMERAIRAHVALQATIQETLLLVDSISRRYEQQITALAQNEGYRAAAEGQRAALAPYRDLMVEVWIAKPGACEAICKPRHLTVTTLIPIRDSHPSCRCSKVPIALLFTPTPSAFSSFVDTRPRP